jgi:hypothetical protein
MSKRLKDLIKITDVPATSSFVVVSDNTTNLVTLNNLRTNLFTPATSDTYGTIKIGPSLSINGSGVVNVVNVIPTQTNNSGKYLTTNGSTLSWGNIVIPPSLPTQGGNGGKFLKTNGAAASWEYLPLQEPLPVREGNDGKFLATDGTTLYWAAVSGGSAVGVASRTTRSATTANIVDGQQVFLQVSGFKSYALLKIETSHAAWVRVYRGNEVRTTDQTRLENEDPGYDSGVIAEVITSTNQSIWLTPATIGFTDDDLTNIYLTVTNKSGSLAVITVTLTLLQLEN